MFFDHEVREYFFGLSQLFLESEARQMKKRQQLQTNCFQCAPAYFPFTTDWKEKKNKRKNLKKKRREREREKKRKKREERKKEKKSQFLTDPGCCVKVNRIVSRERVRDFGSRCIL